MQCLRCQNEALPGKALCSTCFASHQKKAEFEGTDDWVKQQLDATRTESRARQRESKGPETSPHSLIMTLAPALLLMGGLVMASVWFLRNVSFSFSPTPESEQAQGAPGRAPTNGTAAASSPGQPQAARAPGASGAQQSQPSRGDDTSNGASDFQESAPQTIPTITPTSTPTATPTSQPDL